ncbi:MAG: GIY-YIG nuclease family protein [Balneolaceae bacterium]|nr:GIY-YIG nuclease family protein [Balneolaceae bacterium]MBO6547915.1 GIY-YIG nuclease family protein [Balneolaceae bacterium]MBO6648428.1 GIY-YIG nuclease family protein [Balneolaceae bacterium]
MNKGYVYFLTNFQRTTLYIGVTNNISLRVWNHKEGKGSKFTSKYKLTVLVYAEEYDSISDAIAREKQLKNWRKQWKWELVKNQNPKLEDWYKTLRG